MILLGESMLIRFGLKHGHWAVSRLYDARAFGRTHQPDTRHETYDKKHDKKPSDFATAA